MVRYASGHRRGNAQGLVDTGEIVVHVMERNRRFMVFDFL